MRKAALIVALYLTSTLCACAQPEGPPPGYAQSGGQPGSGQDGGPPPAYAQQGWAGGMQSPPGQAQPGGPGPVPMAQSQAPAHEHGGMAAKFRRANTSGDGRLTLQQAQAGGMGGVAKHFAQIDRDQKGYVTIQDVKAWHQSKHAEKAAARGQGGQPPAQNGAYPPPAQTGQQY